MANRLNNNQRVNVNPDTLPRDERLFPCDMCLEKLLLKELYYVVRDCPKEKSLNAVKTSHFLTRKISDKLGEWVKPHRVKGKINELRARYIAFRRYCKKPGVDYYYQENTVYVSEEYEQQMMPAETVAETIFREEGLMDYPEINYIFLTRRFPNFPNDPENLTFSPNEFSDIDE